MGILRLADKVMIGLGVATLYPFQGGYKQSNPSPGLGTDAGVLRIIVITHQSIRFQPQDLGYLLIDDLAL